MTNLSTNHEVKVKRSQSRIISDKKLLRHERKAIQTSNLMEVCSM